MSVGGKKGRVESLIKLSKKLMVFGGKCSSSTLTPITTLQHSKQWMQWHLNEMKNQQQCCMCVFYLRGQNGWRHLVTEVGLGGDLGLGAASALCYTAAAHHRVYILSREDTNTHKQMVKQLATT